MKFKILDLVVFSFITLVLANAFIAELRAGGIP